MTHLPDIGQLRQQASTFFGVSLQVFCAVFFARMMIDIGVRMFYPFIPQLSAGLGLTVLSFSWLLFIRSLAGAAGPVFGILSDRKGRRKIMALGLLCQVVGISGIVFLKEGWVTLAVIVSGIGLAAFLPAQQAYIGDQAVQQRRGRALASVEFSWAFTAIFLLPIVGWLIDVFGWRVPFLLLSLFSIVSAIFVWRLLPPVEHRHNRAGLSLQEVRAVVLKPNVLGSMAVSCLLFMAISCFVTVWGIWLEADFSLTASTLGLVATAIGLAELGGSGSASLFIDRLGQKRGSSLGLLFTGGLMLLLPLTRGAFGLVLPGLVVLGLSFEFTIVALVSLYAEQAPEARGTVFSLTLFGTAVGSAIGTPLTAVLWDGYGLWAVSLVAAAGLFAAFGIAWRLLSKPVREFERLYSH